MRGPLAVRLEARIEYEPNTGCWLWTGALGRHGYGSINAGGQCSMLAHRAAYKVWRGDVPAHLHVCHKCDTPACVNPAHLFLGTNADNVADRQRKGRSSGGSFKGAAHRCARLDPEDVRRIRQLGAARALPQKLIAAQYGISQTHVSNILNGKAWSHDVHS